MRKWLDGGFGDNGPDSIKPLQLDKNGAHLKNLQHQHQEDRSLKWNRYNYIKRNKGGEWLLYNCSTNNRMYMVKEIEDLIVRNMDSINRIESIHPKLYSFLKKKKFIVNDSFDEVKGAISQIKRDLNSAEYFELFVNPTLDCNLKCWYCYETLKKGSCVDNETLCSIMALIKNIVESPKLKEITVSFFGGEPLLRFNKVIWPIIEFTQKMCAEKKKACNFSFTTNGVLLSRKIIDQLYAADSNCIFQVPFDGNREYHDKTKKYANGKGTFDKVIENVMYALSQGFKFTIRCNYTSENLRSFDELILIFTQYAAECIDYGLLKFSYHKVWQADHTTEMETVVNKYENKVTSLDTSFYRCYADRKNSVVVNYNGDVYNCTARDFNPEHREGYLTGEGKIIYNKRHHERMRVRFSNKNCLNCIIFPICNICSQDRLALQGVEKQCLRSYSDQDKEKILLKKIEIETMEEIAKTTLSSQDR